MGCNSVVFTLLFLVICSYCGKEFTTLGRHTWRCKQRITESSNLSNQDDSENTDNLQQIDSSSTIKCCCGKLCKGKRGLKMHQRSCRVINGLNKELKADLQANIQESNDDYSDEVNVNFDTNTTTIDSSLPTLKEGINLPRNDSDWLTANDYFKCALRVNQPINIQDLNSKINHMNETIYNYFSENFGNDKQRVCNDQFKTKYADLTTKQLKKSLQSLKLNCGNVTEIQYVSRELRKRIRKEKDNNSVNDVNNKMIDHDSLITKSFWGYVKKIINKVESKLPSFNMSDCLNYFTEVLTSANPNRSFDIPAWIPKLNEPQRPFNRVALNVVGRGSWVPSRGSWVASRG